ncbi:MAG TPA: hypothetical protein VFP84_40435 [Kofleriaceae bacterium]|nr:hypothetical protein [Kofleriaceae bacterium]
MADEPGEARDEVARWRGPQPWGELPAPEGAYYVSERATGIDVLQCSLRVERRMLFVTYTALRATLSEQDCNRLVLHALIRQLVGDTYIGKVDQVAISSAAAPTQHSYHAFPRDLG